MNRHSINICFLIFVCSFCIQRIRAQVQVLAPSQVEVGENFRLAYTINNQSVEDFLLGNIPSGLELLAGPYTSRQSSYQMINGHTSSLSSITFTYTLYAANNGTFIIPAAHVQINGKIVSSKTIKIKVSGVKRKNNNSSQTYQYENNNVSSQIQSTSNRISGKDLFIKVSANKRRVYEQEPILLTYKVYSLVDLTQLEGKMPELTGFHTQEIPLPQQKSFHIERINGKAYKTVTWNQYLMFPQITGRLSIPEITFKGIVVQQNRSIDPFEAFFNGGSGYVEIKKNVVAPGLEIYVDGLPNKPVDFSGGVGKFSISAKLDKSVVKAGDPVTMSVTISGSGNLKLINQPKVTFPKDFDKYDPKIIDKTKLSNNGVEGDMVYNFLFIPRHQGKFNIPSATFTYYDIKSRAYKTIRSQSFNIVVNKGNRSETYSPHDELTKENDIRDIMTNDISHRDGNNLFYGSLLYWSCLCGLFFIFSILFIIFHRRSLTHADIIFMNEKYANKIAYKRLKKAKQLMQKNKQDEFYNEVLRALWVYVSYKLNISVEVLSRENIVEKLSFQNIDQDIIAQFILALDECEYERYAPGNLSDNMNKTFDTAFTAITNIEKVMNKAKR